MTIPALYFVACLFRKQPLHFFSVNFQPPPLRIAISQTGVAAADFLCASAALYVLLPSDVSISFLSFTAIFLLAIIVALISHVPGGLGVLELVLITMLPHSTHGLVATLLAYRVIYYLFPLVLAVVSVAIATLRHHSARVAAYSGQAVKWTSIVSPRIITGGRIRRRDHSVDFRSASCGGRSNANRPADDAIAGGGTLPFPRQRDRRFALDPRSCVVSPN
ncbi:MAG: hypothetical protein KatS3mg111_4302 [Pirellulaceae bacterium]|nr:MAG: hypothetical protein KatS3mg111_4302 [Pirellulaceae bacterium]